MFGIGYAVQAVIKVVGALPRVFRNPGGVIAALKHSDNFSLAAFLASFAGLFKVTIKST